MIYLSFESLNTTVQVCFDQSIVLFDDKVFQLFGNNATFELYT